MKDSRGVNEEGALKGKGVERRVRRCVVGFDTKSSKGVEITVGTTLITHTRTRISFNISHVI